MSATKKSVTSGRSGKKYLAAGVSHTVAAEAAPRYASLGVILGGKSGKGQSVAGDFDLIALTREGIRKSSLKSLAFHLGISMEAMSRLLHSSHRNIQRKPDQSLLDTLKTEKVLELAAFAQRGIEVLGSRQAFIDWVHSPLPALRHQSPLDILDTSFGIQLSLKILGRLEQGVYS